MNPGPQPPRALFEPDQPGLASTSSMTDFEREELRRLAISIGTEQHPEKVIAIAQEMNALLDRILARMPKPPAND